jgi:glycosyltransferase involved in cell wall biosynthesis
MTDQTIRTLFVGLGNSRVAWYRCVLPAMFIGADWMGVVGNAPKIVACTSYVQGQTKMARFEDYDVIVLQQPRGHGWFEIINKLRAAGKVVLYEIDDYVHGIRKSVDHDFAKWFDKPALREMELCMRACSGMVCSTEYLARRYKAFTPHMWTCANGLDMGRYRLTRPARGSVDGEPAVTIMWSGATGHLRGVDQWMRMVSGVMMDYPHVCFASIGQQFGEHFMGEFGERVISVPFAALETYPAAMMLGDIALAPAGQSSWYRGKSTLRAMEAAALGIPVVADPHYETDVVDGVTGYVADSVEDADTHLRTLIESPTWRETMGGAAKQHAEDHFNMTVRRESWVHALTDAYEVCHG